MNRPIWIRRCLLFRRFILRLILKNPGRFIGRITSRDGFWWVAGIAAVLVIGVFLSWRFWEELGDEEESLSTTVRNVSLVIGAVAAILIAVWRSRVAELQADAAQQTLLNERYQRGAEMLGSEVLGVRLAGIYALESLAKEHPRQYHIQIVNLFCAFLRYPTGGERREEGQDTVEDVQIAVRAIGTRSRTGIELERKSDFRLDLFRANLAGASLLDADLGRAKLIRANLAGASLARANLCQADLTGANISGAHFYDFAGLMGIGERESAAKGLTQQQLNRARTDPNKRPDLDGHVLDAETGDPLVWLRK